MKARITLTTLALVTAFYGAAYGAQDLVGRATAIDGDTIEIRGTRIRLFGIDAPESGQSCKRKGADYRCGQQAALALSDMISDVPVRCVKKDTDRYGRIVAECFSRSVNLNQAMVENGWALAYRQYSNAYVSHEKSAKEKSVGMWAGTFQAPWDYRKSPTAAETRQSNGCLIKGNINNKGHKIYHMPGTTSYGRTRIDTRKGERWFCSEAEAQAAGWSARKP